jgi:hypothetical protein
MTCRVKTIQNHESVGEVYRVLCGAILIVFLLCSTASETAHAAYGKAGSTTHDEQDKKSNEGPGAPRPLLTPEESDNETDGDVLPALPGADGSADSIVIEDELNDLGFVPLGLLSTEESLFGVGMWEQSRREVIITGHENVAAPGQSVVRQDLFLNLLLTASQPNNISPDEFLLLRSKTLYRVGFIDEAAALLSLLPSDSPSIEMLKFRAQLDLTTDQPRRACAIAARTRTEIEDPFWARLRIYCYAYAGDPLAAQLQADLLRESGIEDVLLDTLLANLIDEAALEVDLDLVEDEIHRALVQLVGVVGNEKQGNTKEEDGQSHQRPPITPEYHRLHRALDQISTMEELEQYVGIVEDAVSFGLMGVNELTRVYEVILFADDELEEELSQHAGPKLMAAVYHLVKKTEDDGAKVDALTAALKEARSNGRANVFLKVFAETAKNIEPSPAQGAFALDMAWINLRTGAWETSKDWLEIASALDLSNADWLRLESLWVAQQLVGPNSAEVGKEHVERLQASLGTPLERRAILESELFASLGHERSEEAIGLSRKSRVYGEGPMPQAGVLSGLDAAARAGRQGETVLLTLQALGDSKSAQIPISVLAKTVSALHRAEFSNNAKTLALESLLEDL